LAPSAASADEVVGTRSEKLRETHHVIDAQIDATAAKLVVRRTVFNGGSRHDQAVFWINLPGGAVATGLRTLGLKDDRPFWFGGELMEAEAAAAKYRELTGIGGYYPKDPALLSWRTQDMLALQVFPCPPSQPKTIEYTLVLPTHYEGGKYNVSLGSLGTQALSATAAVSPASPGDRVFIDQKRVPAGTSVVLDKEERVFSLARRTQPTLDGALASVPLQKNRALVRFHIDAAPRLSETPKGAYVVVLLDASRSIEAEDSASLVAAAQAYLSHFEGARVEVLLFDREVRPLEGAFVSGTRAIQRLGKLTIERRNGSALDDALARADKLLAAAPSRAARRIVLMTDLLTRASLTPEKVKGALKSGAVLHIGALSKGEPELTRDDENDWSSVALKTGGVLWQGSASTEAKAAGEMRRVFEEWARPVRLHHVKVVVHKSSPSELTTAGDTLDEGEGIVELEVSDEAVTRVELFGELWAKPTSKVLLPDAREGDVWSALVFGSSEMHELKEEEMMALALRGRAVSPVTSYLAIEPGVRPSTEGLDHGSEGMGFGSGFGRLGGSSRSRGARPSFDHAGFLRDTLKPAWIACGGGSRAATLTVETTRVEVVDVPSISSAGAPDSALKCLERAAWDITLPGNFTAGWSSFTVNL
jgi:hypothetical protein